MALQLIGHRGARGLFPENTLKGFEKTLQLPVSGLELDIVVSRDKQLVVSHEPWMNHLFCTKPDGTAILESEEQSLKLFEMDYSTIKQYDCGEKTNLKYAEQESFKAHKPLLSDVFELIDKHSTSDFQLLLEVKSETKWYGNFQPTVERYAELLANFLNKHPFNGQLIVQSFDSLFLNAFHKRTAFTNLGLLVENKESVEQNLKKLNFTPTHYNLYHGLINEETVELLNQKGIVLIPWTVNTQKEAERLEELGIKSIITDYPNIF